MSADVRRRRGSRQLGVHVALATIVFVGLFPYLFMVFTSLKSNEQYYASAIAPPWPLHPENYVIAWDQVRPYLVTSIAIAVATILATVVLATVSAYVFARYRFVGRKVLFGLIALLMMIPGISSLIPLFVLMRDLRLLNTYVVLVIPHVVAGVVLGTLLIRTYIEQLPGELFEAAQMDGASGLRIFGQIMVPLVLPVIATVSIITVIAVWNDFFWPFLTVTDDSMRIVSTGLTFFQGRNATNWGPLFAGYVIASLPLLLLFTFLSKYFLAGVQGGMPGGK